MTGKVVLLQLEDGKEDLFSQRLLPSVETIQRCLAARYGTGLGLP
jgi:hypothetical protein